jgi:hypothetical protein
MKFVLVFSIFWMILFLISLPIAIKMPKKIEKGFADSAPEVHFIGTKALITFALAGFFSMIFWYLIYYYKIL